MKPEELTKKIDSLQEQIDEIREEIKQTEKKGWEMEVPADILYGWVLLSDGTIIEAESYFPDRNRYFWQQGNWFATFEEAERERDRRALLHEIRVWASEQPESKVDWEDILESKYFTSFDYKENVWFVAEKRYVRLGFNLPYFTTQEKAQELITLFGDRMKELLID